jgi:serine/threonine-protein kinase
MDLSPARLTPSRTGVEQTRRRSDVYSLACMTWEMLAGRPRSLAPRPGRRHRRFLVPPPPITEFAPELPPAVSWVLERAMAVPREQRPPTPIVFAEELREAARETSRVFAGASLAVTRTVGRMRRPGRRPSTAGGIGTMLHAFSDVRLAWRSLRR